MPLRAWLLLCALAAIIVSGIAPFDRRDFTLEHLPTLAAFAFLYWCERRRTGAPLSDLSYVLLFAFTMLHVLGAHYLYSRVPYAEWFAWLHGAESAVAEGDRNHYDRFVHFAFGALVLLPIAELVHRHVAGGRRAAVCVAIAFQAVLSTLYELAEWGLAMLVDPAQAEAYNGQQGDMFDAQKDMALALLGALLVVPLVLRRFR